MNKPLSDEQLVTLEQNVFSSNSFSDAELRQVFAEYRDLRSAQATALPPGQVAVEEADLRWLVVREAESGNGECYETCPARAQCPVDEGENAVITSGCCSAMLLAHFGLAANEEAPA